MHLGDGSLDSSTTLVTSAVSVVAFAIACYGSRKALSLKKLPGFALLVLLVLLGQMVNYSTGLGFSGHLLGAALLAILVGPFSAMLGIAAVQLIQVSILGDGAWSTLGANYLSMGVVAPLVGVFAYRGLAAMKSEAVRVGIASLASILGAALIMGVVVPTNLAALFSTHAMIGLFEAGISFGIFALAARREGSASSGLSCALKPLALVALLVLGLLPFGSDLPDGLESAMTPVATIAE